MQASAFSGPVCPACCKQVGVCVCERIAPVVTRLRILILQHPQEQDFILGSAPLVVLSLPRAQLNVGLSWASLGHALLEPVDATRWAVVYPSSLPRPLCLEEPTQPMVCMDAKGRQLSAPAWVGLVVLDGSWQQAKALWWRNPWLLKLGRVVLHPREPSMYGKLRREPRRLYLSTLEAIAQALDGLGEDPEAGQRLRRVFRTFLQRVRRQMGKSG